MKNNMATEERVLCFKRTLFEKTGVFQGLSLEVEKYLPVVTAQSNVLYINRSEAEQDRRYKQLIPYALIIHGDRILRYRRGKGGQETRLHGLYSVGVGGHISEEDKGLFTAGPGYHEAMRRELMEEVAIDVTKEMAVAVINDDSTDGVTSIWASSTSFTWLMTRSPMGATALWAPNSFPLPMRRRIRTPTNPGLVSAWKILSRCWQRRRPLRRSGLWRRDLRVAAPPRYNLRGNHRFRPFMQAATAHASA